MREADRPAALARIAAALGVPIDRFLDPPGHGTDPGGVAELPTLWDRIAVEADRARLLALARALAASDGFAEPS